MARSALFKWPLLSSSRICYPKIARRLGLGHRRCMSTIKIPPPIYRTPCERCGLEWEHDPERDGRYYSVHMYQEPLAQYRSGGFHPVHLGDTMQGGRYKIVHKLGWRHDGTIWLARDTKYVLTGGFKRAGIILVSNYD